MNKATIYLITFLLSLSIALAVNVNTDKTDYTTPDLVTITITECTGNSILKVISNDEVVDIKSGSNAWSTIYNTQSDNYNGKYLLKVSCTNGAVNKEICVDSLSCTAADPTPTPPPATSPSGGGGGSYCAPKWVCSTWSLCNASLQQERSCYDEKNCKKSKVEVQSCPQCQESWTCSLWGGCTNNVEKRTCVDQHACGTTFVKPLPQKSCNQGDSGPAPAFVSNTLLPPDYPNPEVQEPAGFKQFWDKYGNYTLIALIILVVIIIAILLIAHFTKPKKLAYNHDELVEWIGKERQMGTSDSAIHKILSEQTGWDEDEIHEAFETLKNPSNAPVSTFQGQGFK